MSKQKRPHNPFGRRRVWWSDPGFIIFSLFYLGLGGLLVFWISTLEFPIAAQVSGILLIVVYPVLVLLYKRILSEPNVYVKDSVVRATTEDLKVHRQKVRKEFIKTELQELEKGQKCVALDVWRIDATLSGRHPYFSLTGAITVDPGVRECHIRVQIPEEGLLDPVAIMKETTEYLRIISGDGYLMLVGKYFDLLVLVVDLLRMDDRGDEIPIPILSLTLGKQSLGRMEHLHLSTAEQLKMYGDLLFENGRQITPHRDIELPKQHGAK